MYSCQIKGGDRREASAIAMISPRSCTACRSTRTRTARPCRCRSRSTDRHGRESDDRVGAVKRYGVHQHASGGLPHRFRACIEKHVLPRRDLKLVCLSAKTIARCPLFSLEQSPATSQI